MKIGLYSITYLGCWYRGEALTLPELIRTAKKFGYDGVELDGKTCARIAVNSLPLSLSELIPKLAKVFGARRPRSSFVPGFSLSSSTECCKSGIAAERPPAVFNRISALMLNIAGSNGVSFAASVSAARAADFSSTGVGGRI